ncbi:TPA: hypothetical protein ACH3X3_012867 [Trebouxia sp. C0006]
MFLVQPSGTFRQNFTPHSPQEQTGPKAQKQVRILGLQQLLPLLSLSSRRALVEVQDAHTLRVHFRTSQDLQDSFEGKEQLQKMTEQASRDLLEVERVKLTPGQTSPVVPKRVANKLEVVCSGKMGSEDVPVQVRPMLYLI